MCVRACVCARVCEIPCGSRSDRISEVVVQSLLQIIPQEEVVQFTGTSSELWATPKADRSPGAHRSPGTKWRGSNEWGGDDIKRRKDQVRLPFFDHCEPDHSLMSSSDLGHSCNP